MGNVQNKFSHLGDQISNSAGHCHKTFKSIVTQPKKSLPMPNLGDGRSADQLRTAAELYYSMDTKTHINIAFLGPSTPAKLALINSCRYIKDCIPSGGFVAPKDVAVQYSHCDPAYNHLRFWDLANIPGSYDSRCLYGFDALVLLVGDVIKQSDIALVSQANAVSGCVLIVRTDMDIYQDREFGMLNPESSDLSKFQKRQGQFIKDGIRHALLADGITNDYQQQCIFLISAPGMLAVRDVNSEGDKYVWDEYDFMKSLLKVVTEGRY